MMQHEFDKINNKLDKMDEKLDNYSSRISTAETNIDWIKGHIKIGLALFVPAAITAVGWLVVELWKLR